MPVYCPGCWDQALRAFHIFGGNRITYYHRLLEKLQNHPHASVTPQTPPNPPRR